ncbi:MAG: Uma2 family endonuclease [Pseudomonadota bacterium]
MEPATEHEHKVWTEAELMSLPDIPGKYEIIEGELVVTPGATFKHEVIGSRLIIRLGQFVEDHDLGYVGGSSLSCWMKSGNLRSPDVSFVSRTRFDELEQDVDGFLKGAPDLAVEVLSPSNTIPAMKKKALEYFESGCKLVWLIAPDTRSVTILRPDGSETTVTEILTGEDVVPGFEIAVSELFRVLR